MATIVLIAQEYEPTVTGQGPAGFSVPVRLFVLRGTSGLDGFLGDGATLPADRPLRSWGDRPPGGGGEVWWQVTGHFDDPGAAACAFDGQTPEQTLEICRNRLFVDRMRVVIERHEMLPGETLESVAAARGIDLEALQAANPWIGGATLQPGDLVTIPRVPVATGG